MQAIEFKLQLLEAEVQRQEDPEAPVKLAMIINDTDEATYQETVEPDVKLDETGGCALPWDSMSSNIAIKGMRTRQ